MLNTEYSNCSTKYLGSCSWGRYIHICTQVWDSKASHLRDLTERKTGVCVDGRKYIWQFSYINCHIGKMPYTFWLWQFSPMGIFLGIDKLKKKYRSGALRFLGVLNDFQILPGILKKSILEQVWNIAAEWEWFLSWNSRNINIKDNWRSSK